jgi:hypothetical protein
MAFMSGNRGGFLGGNGPATFDGDITMGSGKRIVLDDGTLAAPSLVFRSSAAGTGFSAQTADAVVLGRAGVSHLATASGSTTAGVSFIANSHLLSNGAAFRPLPAAFASDSTLNTSGWQIIANAGVSTLTLPATALSSQQYVIYNRTGGAITIARNGHTINGAAADLSIAAGAVATLQLYSGTTAGQWAAWEAPAA